MQVLATMATSSLAIVSASETATAPVTIPIQLELVAVIIASIAGVLAARECKLDILGAVGLGVVCGLGGGLLRDMILQVGDVYILKQPLALPLSMATGAVIYLFPELVEHERLVSLLDIFAVGLYAATGADKALVYGLGPLVAVMMGFFTAVGGGMLRDVFLGRVPYIFQRSNFYAFAAIAGSTSYVLMIEHTMFDHVAALAVCTIVTMAVRFVSLQLDIMSPGEEDLQRMTRPLLRFGGRALRAPLRAALRPRAKNARKREIERAIRGSRRR